MSAWYQPLLRFLNSEDGPTAVEYAVMLALIIVVVVTAVGTVGSRTNNIFNNVAQSAAFGSGS